MRCSSNAVFSGCHSSGLNSASLLTKTTTINGRGLTFTPHPLPPSALSALLSGEGEPMILGYISGQAEKLQVPRSRTCPILYSHSVNVLRVKGLRLTSAFFSQGHELPQGRGTL